MLLPACLPAHISGRLYEKIHKRFTTDNLKNGKAFYLEDVTDFVEQLSQYPIREHLLERRTSTKGSYERREPEIYHITPMIGYRANPCEVRDRKT
jgi:hypothetical protein